MPPAHGTQAPIADDLGRTQSRSAKDPVCGMSVDPATAKHKAGTRARPLSSAPAGAAKNSSPTPRLPWRSQRAHRRAPCITTLTASARHPARLRPRARSTPAQCIRRSGRTIPAACPICGMALEPEIATEATGPSAELVDMTRRFWIALALSIPVFALEMGGHLAGLHRFLPEGVSNWIQLALATPVVLWAGWPFFERGWASLKNAQPQHVHPDRHRRRRGLGSTASSPPSRPECFRRRSAATMARSRSISKRRPSSRPSFCLGRCWN